MDPVASIPVEIPEYQDEVVQGGEEEKKTSVEISAKTGKPKKVLTEAQKLAFLKGREKRLANLEKKRQEKLEADQKKDDTKEPVEVLIDQPAEARNVSPLTELEKLADLILQKMDENKSKDVPPAVVVEEPKAPTKPRVKRAKIESKAEIAKESVSPAHVFNWI